MFSVTSIGSPAVILPTATNLPNISLYTLTSSTILFVKTKKDAALN